MHGRPDFQHIKATISIAELLSAHGWQPAARRSERLLTGCCPIHGGDNPRAFVVWRRAQRWRCFTRCQHGGDVLDLAAALWCCSVYEAALRLAQRPSAWPIHGVPRVTVPQQSRPFLPFRYRIPLIPDVPFLRDKGITPATARVFDSGLYTGRGWLQGCVGVRLFTPEGDPLGYAGRKLASSCPSAPNRRTGRWRFPPGLPASKLLYNYHRVMGPTRTVATVNGCVVVECAWGTMRLHQLGLPVVALMGLHVSKRQRSLLSRFDRIVLLLDGDEAGQQATHRLTQELAPIAEIVSHRLPPSLDPDDLSDESLLTIVGKLLCPSRFGRPSEPTPGIGRDSTPYRRTEPPQSGVQQRHSDPNPRGAQMRVRDPTSREDAVAEWDPMLRSKQS